MKTPAGKRLRERARPIVDALPPTAQRAVRSAAAHRPGSRKALEEALAAAEADRDRAQQQLARLRKRKTELDATLAEVRGVRNDLRAERNQARTDAARWARAYQHLVAILRRTDVEPAPAEAPLSTTTLPDRRLAHRHLRWTLLAERIADGDPLEDAVAASVRVLVAGGENSSARALSQSLQAQPSTRVAGALGSGIGAALLGWHPLAWACLAEVPAAVWRRLAADEYFRAGFVVDRDAALDAARLLLEERPDDVPAAGWLAAARRTLVAGDRDLARGLYAVADEILAATPTKDPEVLDELSWLGLWLAGEPAAPVVPAKGALTFATIDYKLPERAQASTNIGDHVQSIAALGHLARHQGLRFTGGDADLGAFVSELQDRVRPELRLATAERDVHLVAVQRDASNLDDVPPGTWAIWFGWHMKEMSDGFDFPLHPNLRPIIVSFHCKHIQMLTPDAIEYLRAHGPIGCRDWSTVDILLSAGVPAYFSGCVTTTVSTVYPELDAAERPGPDAPPVYVEVKGAPADQPAMTHAYPEVRTAPFVDNLRLALGQLETYRREHSKVVTSRLHCYLPSRSIGVEAEFAPFHAGDLRYEGIVGLSDEQFDGMRERMLARLEVVTTAIVEGRSEEEVAALWRAACAEDVAVAEQRRSQLAPLPEPWFDVPAACAGVRAAATTFERAAGEKTGEEVHVALALDSNLFDQLHVVTAALADASSRPLHLWILCRDHDPAVFPGFAATFPEVTTTWLPCDSVDYGAVHGLLTHTTASTMDRLLLPELLGDLPRVVYVDIDTLPVGDIARLYDWDLAGAPLAARTAVGSRLVTSGFAEIVSQATRLNDVPDASHDLIQRMCARFPFDFDAFNAGLLVLDLDRMRADDFCRTFLPYVDRYGMNDQEVLNCYAGPDRAALPSTWNAQPSKEVVVEPDLIHWTGRVKPWSQQYVTLQELWTSYDERVRVRVRRAAAGADSSR